MELPKTILVPTDFSECSADALQYAVQLAAKLGARLYVMHVWQAPIAGWEGGWAIPPEVTDAIEKASRDQLTTFVANARKDNPQLKVEALCLEGDARLSIVRRAKEFKVDLIIMGTHGRRGLSHALLGSVTENVIRNAPCAVLAVRQPSVD